MKKDNFNLLVVKHLNKGLTATYIEPSSNNICNQSNEFYPHPDLINLLIFFNIPLSDIFGVDPDKCHATGISIKGKGDKKVFIITGMYDTEIGKTSINTPRIGFNSDQFIWIDQVIKQGGIIDQLQNEVFEYFENHKQAQLQLDFQGTEEELGEQSGTEEQGIFNETEEEKFISFKPKKGKK